MTWNHNQMIEKFNANAIFAEKKLYISGRYCKPIIPKEKRLWYACKLLAENEEFCT